MFQQIVMPETHKRGISTNISRIPTEQNMHQSRQTISSQHKKSISIIYNTPENKYSRITGNTISRINPPSRERENPESHLVLNKKIQSDTIRSDRPIEESYRYCIGCEEAILTGNMKIHEVKCLQYQKIYTLELQDILSYLQRKIDEVRERSKRKSLALDQEDTRNLRMLTETMCEESEGIQKTGRITDRFVSDYNNAINIGKKWCNVSEEINKLRWFLKIREEIKKRFDC